MNSLTQDAITRLMAFVAEWERRPGVCEVIHALGLHEGVHELTTTDIKHVVAELANARLEGAKAMQEAGALIADSEIRFSVAERIRALDPQQVINERPEHE
jgi:hypothetical protein